jgi:ABC-type transport system substrate-binding protein
MRSTSAVTSPGSPAVGRRSFLGHAAAFGLGATAAGLRSRAPVWAAGETTSKRELVVLQASDVTGLDPHATLHTSDLVVKFNLFDTLVRRHPDGTLHPSLATGWRRTAPTTWHLTLRPGVRWHDGTRFSSVDAKYSLDRTYDATVKGARLRPYLQTVDRVDAPDAETLVIHTRRPDPLIPAKARVLWRRGPLGVHRSRRPYNLHPATRGHGAPPVRVVDQGSPLRAGGQPGLLGWPARRGPRGPAAGRRPRGARGGAAPR